MPLCRAALTLCFALTAVPAHADLGFPDYVKFPPQIQINPDQTLVKEDLGEAEFATDTTGSVSATKRGRHYARWFLYKPAAGEPAPGYYNGTEERIYKAMQAVFAKSGWQLVFVNENKSTFAMRVTKDGKESWAAVTMDAPQAFVKLELVEVGGDEYNLKLSDARAGSVKLWLTQHGIDGGRLSSKGYGKTQPVADNNTDIGRAKNRRVELIKVGCRKP
jgi:hypothetical protein